MGELLQPLNLPCIYDSLERYMLVYLGRAVELEYELIKDSCRYVGSSELDKLKDFVRIFQYRPDITSQLCGKLRTNSYSSLAGFFERALRIGDFPANSW